MKKFVTKIVSVCFVITIIASLTTTAFAADEQLTINSDANVNVGDTVTFTLYLSDCKEDIIGYEMRLFYDSEYLELDKESLKFEKFDGVIHNPNLENKIAMSWTNISQPADFSKKAQFLSVDFKVLKGGEAEISQFVTDMYGDDMTYLKSYKWTYNISVGDDTVTSDKTPLISDDAKTLAEKQGSFINYVDGMGEENAPKDEEHQAVTGVMKNVITNTEVVNVTKDNSGSGNGSSNMSTYFIIGAAVLVVALAVVAVIVVKKRDDENVEEVIDELDLNDTNEAVSDDIQTNNDEIID